MGEHTFEMDHMQGHVGNGQKGQHWPTQTQEKTYFITVYWRKQNHNSVNIPAVSELQPNILNVPDFSVIM
jgi:hypothetical protein